LAERSGSNVEATSRIEDWGRTNKASVKGCRFWAKIEAPEKGAKFVMYLS
jgi:hypothetical protein